MRIVARLLVSLAVLVPVTAPVAA
ncbi:MAG: hypothetical protein QOD70_1956, partial [Frankiales bacterium]|nr:hypothetical protein [Frankiales bacterium]